MATDNNIKHKIRRYQWVLTLIMITLTPAVSAVVGNLQPEGLRVEYAENPVGIDAVTPRLSWRSTAARRDAKQTAYQIQAAENGAALAEGELLWDSGKVKSDQSLFLPYQGPELHTGQQVFWRVRIWDTQDNASDWSQTSFWEMGLLDESDWISQWIKPSGEINSDKQRAVIHLRDGFTINGTVERARIYATARGVYSLELNGETVGNQVLAPGWTSYRHRIQYQTYDVTSQLQQGENTIGAMLADGWYRGYLGWGGKRNHYGEETALRLQLHIRYSDGSEEVITSDDSWRFSDQGPWRSADIYNGEVYDARKEINGWSTAAFDDANWKAVALHQADPVQLVAPEGPAIRRIEEIEPVSIGKSPNGETLVDMGQNLVGWVRLRVNGTSTKAGTEIVIRHAEVLDEKGNLYTENLRGAAQVDRYVTAGLEEEVYEPHFTFHGFRYVGIRGYPGELNADDIAGVVVHSDMARTGNWESSDSLLNQLYKNIVWGQKGNFLDVPTDCPQRDERLGWTGDAQVFAPTAAFNMDVSGFFSKWLADVALDQLDNGSVPHVIPNVLDENSHGTAGWADAATVTPWAMYRAYGDKALLEKQFESMAAWVNYMAAQADEDFVWRPGWQFGDWLSPQFDDVFSPYRAVTGTDLIATAYFAHSADLASRTAKVLGLKSEAKRFSRLFKKVREAFQREFVTATGRLSYETQTAYVLALSFDLLPENSRTQAAERLAADVRERGDHLTTGFLGTPDLTRVLSDYGHTQVAYDLLTQTTYPSWLYPVKFGATTIWERWDAVRTDGTFQSPEMTSFNHYAYGAIGQWMVEVIAGLDKPSDVPGYKRLLIHPQPGGRLEHAQASLNTPYGQAKSAWSFQGDRFTLNVVVPANTSAEVVLPLAAGQDLFESGSELASAEGIRSRREQADNVHLELGSGSYTFSYRSTALRERAADFSLFTENTPLAKFVGDPIAKAELNRLLPDFNDGAHLPPLMTASPLIDLRKYAPEMVDAIVASIPEINKKRRAAIFGDTN